MEWCKVFFPTASGAASMLPGSSPASPAPPMPSPENEIGEGRPRLAPRIDGSNDGTKCPVDR